MSAGIIDKAQKCKYRTSYFIAAASLDNTKLRLVSGNPTSMIVPIVLRTSDKNNASQTPSFASSVSPDPTAVATNGAVMVGKNETRNNNVKKAWLAVDCPARASAIPSLPTQHVSTLLTRGTTAILSMDGRAVSMIFLSVSSPNCSISTSRPPFSTKVDTKLFSCKIEVVAVVLFLSSPNNVVLGLKKGNGSAMAYMMKRKSTTSLVGQTRKDFPPFLFYVLNLLIPKSKIKV
eukprot:7529824-Ditylum_brightwellii.AAC.1